MNEDKLRQACEELYASLVFPGDRAVPISQIEVFARRMQAVGVRDVIAESKPYDNVNDLILWCEREASRLDQTK